MIIWLLQMRSYKKDQFIQSHQQLQWLLEMNMEVMIRRISWLNQIQYRKIFNFHVYNYSFVLMRRNLKWFWSKLSKRGSIIQVGIELQSPR